MILDAPMLALAGLQLLLGALAFGVFEIVHSQVRLVPRVLRCLAFALPPSLGTVGGFAARIFLARPASFALAFGVQAVLTVLAVVWASRRALREAAVPIATLVMLRGIKDDAASVGLEPQGERYLVWLDVGGSRRTVTGQELTNAVEARMFGRLDAISLALGRAVIARLEQMAAGSIVRQGAAREGSIVLMLMKSPGRTVRHDCHLVISEDSGHLSAQIRLAPPRPPAPC
jgi:hypothetical protein